MGSRTYATLLFLALTCIAVSCAEGTALDAPSGGSGGVGGGAATAGTAGATGDGSGGAGTAGVAGSGGGSGSAGTSGATSDSSIDSSGSEAGGGSGGSGAADAALDQGADVITNPCAGVVCNTPPAKVCADANTLTVYNSTGTCDQGRCSYSSQAMTCPQGCATGACVNNPCLGVTCNTPPAAVCQDASNLRVYDAPGSCSNGTCSYGNHTVFCGFGCSNGVCNGDPCTGITCNAPPASYCANASTLTVYDRPGTCQTGGVCSYTTHTEFCSFGCTAGACSGNPCAGVSCNTPPANYCVSATTLRTHLSSGTCSGGNCSYSSTDAACQYGCANGVCQNCMIDADCGSGRWCNSGTCITCNTDQHCGAACSNCTAQSRVCSGGTTCVECTINSQCGAGNYCNNGTCAPCNVAAHCGSSCVACSGSTPSCVAGACSCTTGSCPSNQTCTSGTCTVCKSDSACGPTCAACGGSTPRCFDQGTTSSCVQCLTGADCSGGLACSGAHTCGASCVPPATACSAGGSQDGGCSNAYRISRTVAGTGTGFHVDDTYGLCGRANNFNGSCDARNGSDTEYRIFMRQGETAAITLTRGSSTCVIGWSGSVSLRIYQDTCANCASCPAPTCSTQVYCTTSNTQNPNYVAPADGWYTIVIDSNGPVEDKGGVFDLNVKLTCAGTCGC